MSFILRMPEARGSRAWRGRLATSAFSVAVISLVIVCSGVVVLQSVRDELAAAPRRPPSAHQAPAARVLARVRWAEVKPRLVTRLHQRNPLELGLVWTTRGGRVCGLVNGWGSFGGLTGMTRFYTQGDAPVFKQDGDGSDGGAGFENEWWACNRDRYAVIHPGSDRTGFCATRLGQTRCYDVVVRMWGG